MELFWIMDFGLCQYNIMFDPLLLLKTLEMNNQRFSCCVMKRCQSHTETDMF